MTGSERWRSHLRQQRPESEDERAVSKQWRKLGFHEHKIAMANKSGLPDRFYACPWVQFFCEWKAVGKEPDEDQLKRHEEMRQNGCTVIVCHTAEEFWSFVRAHKK